jgi:arylformamidase
MIYDISVPIRNSMHVWPSDPPVQLESHSHLARDESHTILVTSINCGSHTGTHLDAPSHMVEGGKTLSDVPLEQLVGPARVVEVGGVRSIRKEDLDELSWEGVERVLFKTDNSSHWQDDRFYEEFVYLEPEAAQVLADQGVRLVGIDYLSIDRYRSESHPTHFVLLAKSIVILEGLNLEGVPAGDYQLVALPIKLQQGDGAPVRAILMNRSQR